MKAHVILEADEETVRAWLADLHREIIGGDDPPPEPDAWFADRVRELVEDDFRCAVMMCPIEVTVGDFE